MSADAQHHVKFWPVMTAIFLGSFVTVLSMSTINIAIPVLMHDMNAELSTIQWTITGFMLAMGTVAPLTGFLGDRFSYKRLYMFALIGFTVASGLCAVAWDPSSLIAFRILQGCFTGLVMPATMTIIYQIVPREKQAVAVSLWSLSAMLAPAFGPTISGWLIDNWSWEWLFLINVPIGILAIVLVALLIPYYRLNVPRSFDVIGLVTVVVGSLSLLVAFSEGHKWGWTDGKTDGLIALGLATLALFAWRELKTGVPLLNVRVFRNARYTITLIITSIITVSLYSGTYLTPLFLQNIQRVTPLDSGLILLPASLAMAVAMPAVGKLYARVGPLTLMVAGIALIAVGTLAMSWLSVDVPHEYVILWMTVRNIGIALSTMPASNAGMEEIPRELSGHASSINNWVRNVLGSFAIALFTSMLASRQTAHVAALKQANGADPAIPLQAFTLSVNDVYLLATVIVLAGVPLALLIRKKPKPEMAAAKQEVA